MALLREGRDAEVVQETRLWDENRLCTYSMRKKEGQADYRYFPEPDLPQLMVTEEYLHQVQVSRNLGSGCGTGGRGGGWAVVEAAWSV